MSKIKTLRNEAIALEDSSTRPDALKHWWKCDEATGATSLVDSIGGANLPIGAITSADGIITTFPDVANADTDAALVSPGTSDFIFMFYGDLTTLGSVGIGDSASNRIKIASATIGGSQIVGGTGTTSTTGDPDTTTATWAMVRDSNDSGNLALYKDGVIVGASVADGAGDITFLDKFNTGFADNVAGFAFYVYTDGLPTNFTDIIAFNGAAWANNDKIVWPR